MLRDVAAASEIVDTVLSYCRYNLLDRGLARVLAPLAQSRGLGLISASPLHMRVLTRLGAPAWHPAPAPVVAAARQAADYCAERGVDIADLAMQFALSYEAAAVTLVGMSKANHVARNIAQVGVAPDPELLAAVEQILAPAMDVCWRSGLPAHDDPNAVGAAS